MGELLVFTGDFLVQSHSFFVLIDSVSQIGTYWGGGGEGEGVFEILNLQVKVHNNGQGPSPAELSFK